MQPEFTNLKGMTFDHDFGYFFLYPPKKKREEEKENELPKIVIKSHAFQPGLQKKNVYLVLTLPLYLYLLYANSVGFGLLHSFLLNRTITYSKKIYFFLP